MRVVKVLNNSLVLALDDNGCENILMGKGIGYHKAVGCRLRKEEIEKVFVNRDRSIYRSIIRLAAETDSVYFELSKDVIDYARETFHMELLAHIYLSLTDHLAFAVRRVKEGIEVPNFYTSEMRRFNPNEFQVGCYAVKLIREQLGVALPEDEAGNIAFHFINGQLDHPYNDENRRIRRLTDDVLSIVKYYYQIVYQTETVTYTRYVTHVRLFAQRVVSGQQLGRDSPPLLYDQIQEACASEFKCVKEIGKFIQRQYGVELKSQEEVYLAMHLHLILEEGRSV